MKVFSLESFPLYSVILNSFHSSYIRPVTRIFGRGVVSMSDVYVCIYKQARKARGSGGMLPQETFRN